MPCLEINRHLLCCSGYCFVSNFLLEFDAADLPRIEKNVIIVFVQETDTFDPFRVICHIWRSMLLASVGLLFYSNNNSANICSESQVLFEHCSYFLFAPRSRLVGLLLIAFPVWLYCYHSTGLSVCQYIKYSFLLYFGDSYI